MLDPAFLARLEAVVLRSRTRTDTGLAGAHGARRRGQSLEFADHREYTPGDDIRHVDWSLSARGDRLLVRLFENRDDRTVRVLLDASASMEGPRWGAARTAAAAVAWVGLSGLDRVQVVRFADGAWADGAPVRGRSAIHRAFRFLATGPGGPTGLSAAMAVVRPEGGAPWTVLISDLLVSDWEAALIALSRRPGEAHVVHVIDPRQWRGEDLRGDLRLVDAESGEELDVSVDQAARTAHEAACRAWADAIQATCRRVGIGHFTLDASVPVEDSLLEWLGGSGGTRSRGVHRKETGA